MDKKQKDVYAEINLIYDNVIPLNFMFNDFSTSVNISHVCNVPNLLQMEVDLHDNAPLEITSFEAIQLKVDKDHSNTRELFYSLYPYLFVVHASHTEIQSFVVETRL